MPANVRRNLILSLDPNSGVPALKLDLIGPQRLPIGVPLGTPGYNNAVGFVARGGSGGPYNITILSGAIPTGCTFNSTTGQWSGTPSAQGGFTFVARVSDGFITTDISGHVEVFGNMYPLFGHYSPTPAVRTRPYSYQVLFADATGSTAGITYSISAGALPSGITLSSAGLLSSANVTAAIGTYWFTVRGTKAGATVDVPMSITVRQSMTALGVSATADVSLSTMLVGQYVEATIALSGAAAGLLPIVWTVSANSLPPGLSLKSLPDGTARIYGAPKAVTDNTFAQPTLTATDATGQSRNVVFGSGGIKAMSVNSTLSAAIAGHFLVADPTGLPTAVDFLNLFFSDGGDGDFVLDGTNAYAGVFSKSGNFYTPLRHISANNLKIASPGVLVTGTRDIDVADTFDMSGCPAGSLIYATGLDAVGQVHGAFAITSDIGGTTSGINGANGTTTGAPATPATPTASDNVAGGGAFAGGAGGAGTAGAGGLAGQAGPINTRAYPRRNPYDSLSTASGPFTGGLPGGAGGGGRGNSGGTTTGGSGGGSGAGGGIGRIRCRRFKTDGSTAAGAIDFGGGKGGNGSNGSGAGAGGGGAGSGGGGGYFSMIFAERIGAAVTNLIDVSGGDSGTAGTAGLGASVGSVGVGGDSGIIEVIDVGAAAIHVQGIVAHIGTAGGINRMTI